MDILSHVSINAFPMIMLLVIYINDKKKITKTLNKRLFDVLTVLTLGVMAADILCNGLSDAMINDKNAIMWFVYIVQMLLTAAIPCIWLLYACCRLRAGGNGRGVKIFMGTAIIVNLCLSLLIVLSPWTHLLFYITEDGKFQQGSIYILLDVIEVLMFFFGSLTAVYIWNKGESKERRRESVCLIVGGILTLIGFSAQYISAEWWIGGPCMALALLLLYINTQNRQIVTDGLTGLNNRGEFNQYLKKRAEQSNANDWGMLMLDMNDFKEINDNLGHGMGDEALCLTADILRSTLGRDKTFIARYGGDEFVVIGEWEKKQVVLETIARIHMAAEEFNANSKKPYQLSFSIGYALWSETEGMEELIEMADERMYEEKIRIKKMRS